METKRTYTVPVLLLIVTVLTILAVMLYSKLLISQLDHTTQEGKDLTSRYNYAVLFADSLSTGADLMLKDDSVANRVRSKRMIGQALTASGEAVGILSEASHRSSGKPLKEAFAPISTAMTKMISESSSGLYTVGEHEGPLTPAEKEMLQVVRDGAATMKETLMRFRAPGGEAGYRQMAAGGPWIDAAVAAARTLEDTASKLK